MTYTSIARRVRGLGVGNDVGLSVIFQGLSAVVTFGGILLLTRSLPKEELGIYTLAFAAITIAGSIADFGLVPAVMPRIAVAWGIDTPAYKVALVLRFVMVLLAWLGLNAYLLVTGESWLLPYANLAYCTVFFSSKTAGLRQFPELFWRLKGRTYVVSALGMFDSIMVFLGLLLLKSVGRLTIFNALVVTAVAGIPGFLLIILPMLSHLRDTYSLRRPVPWRYYLGVLSVALPMAFFALSQQISGNLERLVISYFGDLAKVASYDYPVRALNALQFIAGTIGFGIVPVVAQAYKRVRTDISLSYIISVCVRLVFVLGFAISVVCLIFGDRIILIFGAKFAGDAYILRIYSIITAMTFVVVLLDQFLIAIGSLRQALFGLILSILLSVVFEVIFIQRFAIYGVMYAKMAVLAILIPFQLMMLPSDIRRAAARALLHALVPVSVFAALYFATASLPMIVRGAIAIPAVAALVVATKVLRPSDLRSLREIRVT